MDPKSNKAELHHRLLLCHVTAWPRTLGESSLSAGDFNLKTALSLEILIQIIRHHLDLY